jgi:capsular polysaccharide biosynthesis protein
MLASAWLVILLATLLSAGAVQLGEMTRKPEYRASAQLFAVVAGDAGARASREGEIGATVRMLGYGQLAKTRIVMQRTIDDLHLDTTPAKLAKRTTVTLVPNSVLMGIQVTGDNADTTRDTINSMAKNLVALSAELENGDSGPAAQLVLVDQAAAAHLIPRSWMSNLEVGGGLGFGLSCVLVLAWGVARDRVLGPGQLEYVVKEAYPSEKMGQRR